MTADRGGATLLFNIPNPADGVSKAGQDIDEKVGNVFYKYQKILVLTFHIVANSVKYRLLYKWHEST